MIPDGLRILLDFVTVEEELALLHKIGEGAMVGGERGRERSRVERYGLGVRASGYTTGTITDEFPPHIAWLCGRLVIQEHVAEWPNAVTVNEYQPGQGLGFHTDVDQAGEVVSILGLAGSAELVFRNTALNTEVIVPFERRMLIQLTGPSRWQPWEHAIRFVETRRISIVFRRAE